MEKTKLFQASTKLEAPLVSKRGGWVIHISFDGQRKIESQEMVILRIPPGGIEMSPMLAQLNFNFFFFGC